MFGRSVRTPLGTPRNSILDYDDFEHRDLELKKTAKVQHDRKHRAKELQELEPGDTVWVEAPTDSGAEGIILGKHNTPDSYCVKVGFSEIRRNRKHLRLLPTILPEAKESDIPTTSKEFEYDRSDPQRGGPADSVETSQEEVPHTLDGDASFSEEVGARTTKVVETDEKQAAVITKSGRQIRNKKFHDYVYY